LSDIDANHVVRRRNQAPILILTNARLTPHLDFHIKLAALRQRALRSPLRKIPIEDFRWLNFLVHVVKRPRSERDTPRLRERFLRRRRVLLEKEPRADSVLQPLLLIPFVRTARHHVPREEDALPRRIRTLRIKPNVM